MEAVFAIIGWDSSDVATLTMLTVTTVIGESFYGYVYTVTKKDGEGVVSAISPRETVANKTNAVFFDGGATRS